MFKNIFFIILSFSSLTLYAQHSGHSPSPSSTAATMNKSIGSKSMSDPAGCGEMMAWDKSSYSCIALPMDGMPMDMWMIHGNSFLVQSFQEGSRGSNRFSVPNMIMAQVGHSCGNQYFDTNLMLTFEKWTFSKEGYPELLQIGELNSDAKPYIDAQHPHSSPIMGLTFSDTIRWDESKNYLKIFFAPRGQATEGPIAFMHRPTGMINPDAPLGHHIGQDVSHITSTVLGASLSNGPLQIEISTFNGTEPAPTKVDLPLGPLNSYGARIIYGVSDEVFAMISAAEVTDPEPNDPTLKKVKRYSASIYSKCLLSENKIFYNTFILGYVNNYDHVSVLRSALNEFWLTEKDKPNQYWGRIEFVERTATELGIYSATSPNDPNWVSAITVGYTYKLELNNNLEAGLGAAVTKDILPEFFRAAYSGEPISGKIFFQLAGMKMGNWNH